MAPSVRARTANRQWRRTVRGPNFSEGLRRIERTIVEEDPPSESSSHFSPDRTYVTDDLVAEGDLVVHRSVFRTAVDGEVLGVIAHNGPVEVVHMEMWRVTDGKIVERWGGLGDLGEAQHLYEISRSSARCVGELKRRQHASRAGYASERTKVGGSTPAICAFAGRDVARAVWDGHGRGQRQRNPR